jgi:hypothetical protein
VIIFTVEDVVSKRSVVLSLLLSLTVALSAAPPVAKITSAEPFQLRGQTVQVAGVPSWSALPGDEIVAGKGSLLVVFKDGSRAVIAANSSAKIEKSSNDGLAFRLLSGWMTVTRVDKSSVRFYSNQTEFAPPVNTEASVAVGRTINMSARVPVPPPPGTPGVTSTR